MKRLLALVFAVAGCASTPAVGVVDGTDGGKDSGGTDTVDSISNDLAGTDCARKFECMPYATSTRAFGDDVADCTAQAAAYQRRALSAPGASPNFSGIRACVVEMKAATCQAYLDSTFGMDPTTMPKCSAFTPGSLGNGAGCAYGSQCSTNLCASAEGKCGKCAAPPSTVGAPCDAVISSCDPAKGLLCNYQTKLCAVAKRRGEPCSADSDCFYNLLCGPGQTCGDYPNTVGASCNPVQNNCSFRFGAGLVCNNQTISCQLPDTTAKAGQPCGLGGPTGGLVLCAKGAMCDGSKDGFSGNCLSGHSSPVGGACPFATSPADGPACQGEAQCVGGTCKVDDPATCK